MINPIMQALNATGRQSSNNMLGRIAEIKQLLNGQAPQVVYNRMMQSNPAFANFVRQNAGKSPEQLAQEYGVDLQTLRDLLR